MELIQKLTFSRKKYHFVASLPDRFVPNSVLLFEPRICYPALRVTSIENLFQINRFYRKFALKIDNFLQKYRFFIFFIFFIFFPNFLSTFVRIFILAGTYRPEMLIAQIKAFNEISPKMKLNRKLNAWSRVKNSIETYFVIKMSPAFRNVTFLTPYYS